MIRKPTSGDSDQREREAERARKHSKLSASGPVERAASKRTQQRAGNRTAHGAADGESAHGALPRQNIEGEAENQ